MMNDYIQNIKLINTKDEFNLFMANQVNNLLDYEMTKDSTKESNSRKVDNYIANMINLLDNQKKYIEENIPYEFNSNSLNSSTKMSVYDKYQEMKRKRLLLSKGKNSKIEENNFIKDKSNSLFYNKTKEIKKNQIEK